MDMVKKNLQYKSYFFQKRIGGSKTTTKRSVETADELPISTFFNEEEENIEEGKLPGEDDTDNDSESNFPVFDAMSK